MRAILILAILIGLVGTMDYEDAKLQEIAICGRVPYPTWCDAR